MKKIVIAELKTNNLNSLFRDLSSTEAETVSGGGFNNYYIMNNSGDIEANKLPTFPGGGGGDKFSSNKINTIDYSRSNYVLIYSL